MDEITKIGVQYVAKDIKEQELKNAAHLVDAAVTFIRDVEIIINKYEILGK